MSTKIYLQLLAAFVFSLSIISNASGQKDFLPPCEDEVIEKVRTAMLCMQRYSWEHGTAMQGMLEIGDTTALIIMARESVQRKNPDGRLSMVGSDNNIADTGVNGPGVLAAYKITNDVKYLEAARAQYEYLKEPESRNASGVILHNNKSKVIFSDNMFMVAPFLALMNDFDESMAQIEGIRRVLWNEEKKLFHHIRIEETGEYKDIDFWGGGNGWCAAAMAQVIDILPAGRKSDKQKLVGYYTDLIDGCLTHQLPGGLFYDNIIEANFEETTMPAMLAYSIYTGVRAGWLDSKYLEAAEKMRAAVYANVDEFGLLQNASKAPRFNSPGTSTEGQAFFLMMEGAFRKLKQQKEIVKRPNIVLIMSDDQGWGDLGFHGNTNIQTPNIDKLANEGARFERFYVAPLCAPTRAGLLTGRYHLRTGVIGVGGGEELMNLDELTLADVLKQADYVTGCFGKWHNGLQYPYHPNGRGFDEFFGFCSGNYLNYFDTNLEHNGEKVKSEGYIADVFTKKAMEFIEMNNSNKTGKPFFCYVPYNTPHSPFQVPDKYYDDVSKRGISMLGRAEDNESKDRTIAALAMCENIDWNVGRIISKLRELDLTENTIVIYLSDNGPADFRWNGDMKGKKASVDEGGVRVPFFIKWPGQIPEGKVVKSSGAYIDILPTLAGLCDISLSSSKPLDGISLKNILTEKEDYQSDRILFSAIKNRYAVRKGPYLMTRNKLYNLKEDPGQYADISNKKPELFDHLSDTLKNWITDVTADIDSIRWLPVGYAERPETRLDTQDSELHRSEEGNLSFGARIRNGSYISNWDDTASYILWNIETHMTGKYEFSIDYTCALTNIGSEIQITCGEKSLIGKITEMHDPAFLPSPDRVERHQVYEKEFKNKSIGVLQLEKGKYKVILKALEIPGKNVIDLNSIKIRLIR